MVFFEHLFPCALDEVVADLDLPALVDVPGAADAARGPGAVGDADEDGGGLGAAARLPELEDEREEGGVDEPDGGEHEEDDGDAGDEPHDAHLQLQQPVPQAGEPAPRHLPVWAAAAAVHSVFSTFEDHAFLFMFKV